MKKKLALIVFALCICSVWSQSIEQKIRNVLLETRFSEWGIYDGNSITFKEENGKLLWERVSSSEVGSYTLGGEAEINGKKISLYYKWCSEGAEWHFGGDKNNVGWEGASDLEFKGLDPDIGFENCRYKLVGAYEYKGGEISVGDRILVDGFEAIKADEILAVNATCTTYCIPDENGELCPRSIIYNRIEGDSYIDINCARILPGALVPVRAKIPNSKNLKGENGTWYYGAVFLESNFWNSNTWFFVPDSVERKVRKDFGKLEAYEVPYHVLDFKESYVKEAVRLGLSHSTREQKDALYSGSPMRDPYDEFTRILPKLFWKTKLEEGKFYVLEDNLKMRSGPKLADEKLTTAKKGTKTKVVKCGPYEIIDNIYSRWVQVEFDSAEKDKDGNAFDGKKSYWCFGGYLK